MVKPTVEPGAMIDGFRLGEIVHQGGMATLWRGHPRRHDDAAVDEGARGLDEGADPAAIVSFEMEQMILPRLAGVHVPTFRHRRFCRQPYVVMERIRGKRCLRGSTSFRCPMRGG